MSDYKIDCVPSRAINPDLLQDEFRQLLGSKLTGISVLWDGSVDAGLARSVIIHSGDALGLAELGAVDAIFGKHDSAKRTQAQIARERKASDLKEALGRRPTKPVAQMTAAERDAALNAMLDWWMSLGE